MLLLLRRNLLGVFRLCRFILRGVVKPIRIHLIFDVL